ncbi:MAG: S8 family serine peptidase [Armatimonadetes bacterium]|nr:S8 family serine peptidase [Armatimonadota bacterium]
MLAASLVHVGQPSVSAQPDQEFAPGELLVKFKPGTAAASIADAHRRNGGQVQRTIAGIGVQVVRVPAGQERARVAGYRANLSVEFAEVNGVWHAFALPNDPRVGEQWQYHNTGQTGGTADADIDAPEAWDLTTGSSTVNIAILDTGIDQSHEDLASKITKNVNFTTSRTVDDRYGHGTHVAGSAAAVSNNGLGVAGTCQGCVLYNVKVLADNGSGSWSWVASGITWAADNGAHAINMSLGGSGGSSTVEAAVNYAWGKGVVLVAAAGNSGSSSPSYPAFYANVIAVAATTDTDAKASFSNFGSWVDVAAPGEDILSTAPDHRNRIWGTGVKYGTISGTSMASPHVAGVAGLVWSSALCASGDNACVRSRVETEADPIAGTGTNWTYGRINAKNSVTP